MSLSSELTAYELWLHENRPELLQGMNPGLDDTGVGRLREAIAPLRLTEQVETLYRWRDGGSSTVFGGWWMRPVDALLEWREFCIDQLEHPPVWLPVFDDHVYGIVTLEVPGHSGDDSLWSSPTHDTGIFRLAHSLEAAVAALNAAALDESLSETERDGALFEQGLDSRVMTPYLLARTPDRYVFGVDTVGAMYSDAPETAWPEAWLASVGLSRVDGQPRGATHTIAELIELSKSAPVSGTIRARAVAVGGQELRLMMVVDDGTGRLDVAQPHGTPILERGRGEMELDVTLDAGAGDSASADSSVGRDGSTGALAGLVGARWPAAVPATMTAVRPLAD
ncbi:hypothetical protein [Frondihabitans australicus]|uniref:Uncharacterized protein n=1 Tax=Frondihabitans australicus TaxID=386892 RepID=A0A495IG70_9MICO|nr:hypothetical protein [Frondihabitans australicus]RKR75012.1 hypothetical protein C8E83_2146 [Frondihabitans australicus]